MVHGYAPDPRTSYGDHNVVEASPHPMTSVPSKASPDRRRTVAHLAAASSLLLDAGFVLLLAAARTSGRPGSEVTTAGGFVMGVTFPVIGWVIAAKRPDNSIGWIFLGVGLSQALATFAGQYATVGLLTLPGSLPAADIMAWLNTWIWTPGFALLLTATVLLFPDGHPPSRRWRVVLWTAAISVALIDLPIAVMGWPDRGADLLGPGPSMGDAADPTIALFLLLTNVGLILMLLSSAASIAGLVVRFRRSTGVVRAQLKWFAAAGLVEITMVVVTSLLPFPAWVPTTLLAAAVSPLLPIAAALAIVRYRLYDIDRIISRSVAYLLITGLLAGLFSLLVVLLQSLLAPFTESNALAVAGSTLVVAAAFQPLRRRIQSVVDRRFNRARVDAARAEAELASLIRDVVDADAVVGALVTSTERTLQPAASGVWIRGTAG